MATKTVQTRCSNGVSYGHIFTAVAADVSAEVTTLIFDFDSPHDLAAAVTAVSSVGAPLTISKIEYPAVGQVQVTLSAHVELGDVVSVVAQNALH